MRLHAVSKADGYVWYSQGLRLRQTDMMEDGIASSSSTLTKMASSLRKLVLQYNRGRVGPAWRRTKKWVLGLLEVGQISRRPILKVVRGRSREDLLPTIICHVRGGSQIVSDEWRAYQRALTNLGFDHHTVCHKRRLVDPYTGAHTQHLERAWQTFKVEVWRHRGNRTTNLLKEHLRVIEWEYWLGRNHRFHIISWLLHDIRKYAVHSC
ncbi:uncharacterized protein LOC144462222 [Epinephelus lanceolatus]